MRRPSSIRQERGFTLAELAISMIIIALLIGGLLGPIGRQVDQSHVNTTQKQLEDIKEALLGYAVINRRLPCPDLTGDGLEDRLIAGANAGACGDPAIGTVQVLGTLPWATLNTGESDAWNTRFGYRVADEFSVTSSTPLPASIAFGLSYSAGTAGNIVINQRNAAKTTTILAGGAGANPPGAVAVVWSFGKNGYGGTQAGGTARAAIPAANVDETANATNNANTTLAAGGSSAGAPSFIVRTPTDDATGCNDTAGAVQMCEFDDQLLWLSASTLISRMVVAGRMP